MRDIITNKLASFQSTLLVADDPDNTPVWQNQPPAAFSEGLAAVRPAVAQLASDGAKQSINITGTAGALHLLRKQFTDGLYPLARATFQCLTALGRTEDAAKANFTPSHLHDARAIALAGLGETVLNLAEPLAQPPAAGQPAPGDKYGVTAAAETALDALWQKYSVAVGAPVGARAKRKAITGALPGQAAAIEQQFAVLDDLILQFNATPAGQRFTAAWFDARQVVDAGHRYQTPAPEPVPAAAPAAKA